MDYPSALRRLKKADVHGSKPGLSRIKKLCDALGNPQREFKTILVAGTNGKGSTCAMLSSILKASGKKTGAYYSPHIFDFRERMQVNGKMISKKDCARALSRVFDALDANRALFKNDAPTFFEIATAAAFVHFSRMRVDFAVLEVGMGGRLDATNACDAELSIITSIGIDHSAYLGKTEGKIAWEKAGIAKKGKPLVCALSISPQASKTIFAHCKKAGATFARPSQADAAFAGHARLALRGRFQILNASSAICAARLLGVRKKHIAAGLSRAFIPGRMQIASRHPLLLIDCAHNLPAAKILAESLPREFSIPAKPNSPRRALLYSSMKDKDFNSILRTLQPHFDCAVVFSPPLARAANAKTLLGAAKKAGFEKAFCAPSPKKALALAKRLAGKNGAILCCGSIYSLQHLFGSPELCLSQ